MSKQDFRLTVLVRTLENETCLAEALFFPEVSRYAGHRVQAVSAAASNARQALENEALARLHTRVAPAAYELDEITVTIDPPRDSLSWRTPVTLQFQWARWQQNGGAWVAFVPALAMESIAPNAEELAARLPSDIKAELLRRRVTASLGLLLWEARTQTLEVQELSVTPEIRTPKQHAAAKVVVEEKSTLKEVADEITQTGRVRAFMVDADLARLSEALTTQRAQSVLLIGPSGVGKTALVRELARQRGAYKLGGTPFWTTGGARLVAGQTGFGMWQERCQAVCAEVAKLKAILHLGNLVELLEVQVGKRRDEVEIPGRAHEIKARLWWR